MAQDPGRSELPPPDHDRLPVAEVRTARLGHMRPEAAPGEPA
ncbi:hypothetical protein [Streptomyces sp. NPDC059631]